MAARRPVKISKHRAKLVGVIGSRTDLRFALRMTNPPDLFELRLDRLVGCLDELQKKLSILRTPLILTARHPFEGGANKLSVQQRRALLQRFLSQARYVDVELRSANALRPILEQARRQKIGRIISFHDFSDTPAARLLKGKARAARSAGADIFKVATRTDTPGQLARLLEFWQDDVDLARSTMGIGKLGALSRLIFSQLGSALVYVSLRQPTVEGQLSIQQLRFALSALKII